MKCRSGSTLWNIGIVSPLLFPFLGVKPSNLVIYSPSNYPFNPPSVIPRWKLDCEIKYNTKIGININIHTVAIPP